MTREEAIEYLEIERTDYDMAVYKDSPIREALNMAIEALKVPERKKGKWVDEGLYRCSACNELWVKWWAAYCPPARMYKEMKYCPNCGAKMEEEKCKQKQKRQKD